MGIWQEVSDKVGQAKSLNRAVDENVREMVKLVEGRLRRAYDGSQYSWDTNALRRLKRELRSFDMTTGKWKD